MREILWYTFGTNQAKNTAVDTISSAVFFLYGSVFLVITTKISYNTGKSVAVGETHSYRQVKKPSIVQLRVNVL